MGHVEPDGAASGAPAPPLKRGTVAPPHPVWPLWWALKREFPIWKAPASWLGTPGSWTYFGNDFVTGLRRNASTARAFALLDATPDDVEAVTALAALNLKRHERMFQFVALLYISIPVTVILGLAEVMPDGLIAVFRDHQSTIWQLAAVMTLAVGAYLIGVWRARQLLAVIELWRIERRLSPADGGAV
ncbi:hypothetical protein N0B44_20435 [Roseibacterium beibuensis]|uniref:hypothetical protein n=1 Tax=[Roseibacterium] beibuensis TaxID=1193142 RepID=UPI00217E5176|nr:hypothetical protein [Roseibacterium beibuensis]MCS6625283.1 hypothetical protein [Roseibacterium beibuensis]